MNELFQTIPLSGFDPAGGPEIRVMTDGTVCLVLNFMPPSDMEEEEESFFDHFDQELEKAVGVPVTWEDRERFLFQSAHEDTVPRLTAFIKQCRRNRQEAPSPKKRGVCSAVQQAVGKVVAAKGFRFQRKEEAFIRTIPEGKEFLYASLLDYRPVYQLSFTMGIQLDAVSALLERFGASGEITTQLEYFGLKSVNPWGAGFWLKSPDVDVNKDFLETGRQLGFWDTAPKELNEALQEATSFLQEKILPFFDRFQDVASIDDALHGRAEGKKPGTRWWQRDTLFSKLLKSETQPQSEAQLASRRALDSRRDSRRPMTAIAIAYLGRNPRFEKLVTKYQNEVATFGDAESQKFQDLVAFLREQRNAS